MASKNYQLLSDAFVARVNANGERGIDPFDLCKIAAWKSARVVASRTANSPERIQRATSESRRALRDWLDCDLVSLAPTSAIDWENYETAVLTAVGSKKAGTGLMQLEGVQYPMASAILRVWNRKAFPVIDRHAVRAVQLLTDTTFNPNTGVGYTSYVRALVETSVFKPTGGVDDVHERDQIAMNKGLLMANPAKSPKTSTT